MAADAKLITCERCGQEFGCSVDDVASCWCAAESYRVPLPREAGVFKGCLCPSCLRATARLLQGAGGGPAAR